MKTIYLLIFFLLVPGLGFAKPDNPDAVLIKPPADGSRHVNLYQSKNLYQWGYNLGLTIDYAYEPVEVISAPSGARVRGVIDDLYVANFHGALGLMDWFSVGFNMPGTYSVFYDPNSTALTAPREKKFALGDGRLDFKFRILDIDRYRVGFGTVLFGEFPTGDSRRYSGNGQMSGGGKLIADLSIVDRVYLTLNAGYQMLQQRFYNNRANAEIDDLISAGAGISWAITDSWALAGEAFAESMAKAPFKHEVQRPGEFLASVRFTPQTWAKGLGMTVGAGRGLYKMNGFGASDWRGLVQINYRRSDVVALPPPPPPVELEAAYEEKIVITQRIHFEFNRYNVRSVSNTILDDVVMVLERNPQIKKVQIEGHTDSVGSDKYNEKLSQKRAENVRAYLISKGISADRLVALGVGESRPVASNDDVEGRAHNRRTEFTVLEREE